MRARLAGMEGKRGRVEMGGRERGWGYAGRE